jgi:hypothetical protein
MATINLGDIVFGLGADSSRLRTALRDILDFGDAVEQVAQSQVEGSNKVLAQMMAQERAINRAKEAMLNFNQSIRMAGGPSDIIKLNQDAFKQLTDQMTTGTKGPLEMQRATMAFSASLANNTRTFKEWSAAASEANKHGTGFLGFVNQMGTAASLVTGPLGGLAFRITLLSNLLREGQLSLALWVGGAVLLAQGIVRLAESTIKAELGLQRMRLQMASAGDGAFQTAENMKFIVNIAQRFGVPFEDIAQHFVKMELAAKGTRMEGSKMMETFQNIVAYGANMRLSQTDLDQAIDLTTRSITRQRVSLQDLKQIGNVIPAFRDIAEKAMGTDAGGFNLLLKRGLVMAETFWPKFWAEALKSRGIDPMAKVTDSIAASMGRFKNSILFVNNAFNDAVGLSDKYTGSLDRMTDTMTFLARNMDIVLKIAGTLAATLAAGFIATTIAANIFSIITAFRSLATAIATAQFSLALFGGPLAVVIGVATAIAAGVAAWFALDTAIGKTQGTLVEGQSTWDEYLKNLDKAQKAASFLTGEHIKSAKAELLAAQSALLLSQVEVDKFRPDARLMDQPKAGEEAAKTWFESFKNALVKIFGTGEEGAVDAALNQWSINQAKAAAERLKATGAEVERIKKGIDALTVAMEKQKKAEDAQRGPTPEKTQAEIRLETIMREYGQLRDETDRTFLAMQQGPKALADELEKIGIEKTLETWRRKFNELNEPVAITNQRLAVLDASLKKLRDAQKFDKEFMSLGQTIQYAFGELGKNAIDKFSNALANGTLHALKFKDLVTSAIEAIIKKLLELAVLAPMMNALFGDKAQMFSLASKGTGTAGLFGDLLKMFGLQGGGIGPNTTVSNASGSFPIPYAVAHGGTDNLSWRMGDPSMFIRAPRLHTGLMPDEYPAVLQTGEKVTPRGGSSGGGGNNVMIKISHPPDTQARASSSQQSGMDMHEIIISHVQQGLATGRLDPLMANRFGARPRPTLR